jgi:small-conductance mechanosensitive channel
MDPILAPLTRGFLAWWEETLRSATPFAIHLLQALLVSAVVWGVGARVRTGMRRAVRPRLEDHTIFVLDRALVLLTWLIILGATLAILGVDLTAGVTALGIITLAASLAVQDILKNFVAGLYLLIEQPFRIGQRIKIKEYEGVVQSVSVRVTVLQCDDGAQVMVPNQILFSEAIINRGRLVGAESVTPPAGPEGVA